MFPLKNLARKGWDNSLALSRWQAIIWTNDANKPLPKLLMIQFIDILCYD